MLERNMNVNLDYEPILGDEYMKPTRSYKKAAITILATLAVFGALFCAVSGMNYFGAEQVQLYERDAYANCD